MGIREVSTIVFLGINGWKDWKKREISLLLTAIYGCIGFFTSVAAGRPVEDYLVPAGLGILFLVTGLATDGALGLGDGWLLISLALMLDTGEYIKILFGGMLLAAATGAVLLVICKKSRKTEIPFVPFLFLAYVGGVFIWK